MKTLVLFLALNCLYLSLANSNITFDTQQSDGKGKWLSFEGAPQYGYLGMTVNNIGDFNGDGIDDMAISSPYTQTVSVIYGQKDGFSKDSIIVNSTFSEGFQIKWPFIESMFGFAISKAIDLNRDGLCEIVIGGYNFSVSQGFVSVIYGKKGHKGDIVISQDLSFFPAQGFIIFGPQASTFGYSVGSARDFNGDGFDDLLVGAPLYQSYMGAAYVIYGKKGNYGNIYLNETFNSQQVFAIIGAEPNARFGTSVDGVGDINGDGMNDIIIGAIFSSASGTTATSLGAAYILYGEKNRLENSLTIDPSIDSSKGFFISGPKTSPTSRFGGTVTSAGDINGDGIGDILIGTQVLTPNQPGGAFIVYGRNENWRSFNIINDSTLYPNFRIIDSRSTTYYLGSNICAGDINGDGFDDILVRARDRTNISSLKGYIAVVYGSPTPFSGSFDISSNLTEDTGFLISGGDLTTASVANAVSTGDFNNDHIDDIIIGAPQYNSYSGKAYVVFGSNECPKNCSTCQLTKCFTCFKGYGLYQGACGICPSSTYLSEEGICQECPDNCIQCKSSSKCQVCADGYSLSDSKICISGSQEAQAAISSGLFDGASGISNALAIGSSVPTNFGLVAKILRNTKYLNISVSKDLQETFNAWKISTGIFPAPDSNSKGSLPLVFERYGMEKAFLINYWKSFMMIVIGFVVFVLNKSAGVIFSKNNSVSKMTRTINVMASNFVLTQFYGSIDDILFYFVLDLRSSKFTSSGFRSFGFIVGLLLLLVGFGVTGVHGVILYRYQRIKKQGGGQDTKQAEFILQFLKKYENIKLFFKDFKDIDVFQQAFLLINIARSLLSSFVFTMFFRYPLLQILLLTTLNICILVYLFTKKPFKDLTNAYAQYFCESILLLAYLSILILAFKDEADSEASGSIKNLSMVVIVCNMMLLVGSAIFMFVNIGGIVYKMYQERKSLAAKKKSSIMVHSRLGENKKIDESQHAITLQSYENQTMNEIHLNHSAFTMVKDQKIENFNNSEFTQNDSFQNNTLSPNLGPRRKIRRETVHRTNKSPALKPSLIENSPNYIPDPSLNTSPWLLNTPIDLQVERGDSSFMQLHSQNSFLLNPERVQEEFAMGQNLEMTPQFDFGMRDRAISVPMRGFNEEVTRNRSGTVAVGKGDRQFGFQKARIKKIRR